MKPTSKSQLYPNHIYDAPRCNPRPVCLTSCLSLCWDSTFRGGFQTNFRLCLLGRWVTGLLYFVVVVVFVLSSVLSISTFFIQVCCMKYSKLPTLKVYHLIGFNIHIYLWNNHHNHNKHFCHPPTGPLCLFLTCLSLCLHAITDLLSFSQDEPAFSRNLCRRTYTVCVPFAWWVFFFSFLFTNHDDMDIHPCSCVYPWLVCIHGLFLCITE